MPDTRASVQEQRAHRKTNSGRSPRPAPLRRVAATLGSELRELAERLLVRPGPWARAVENLILVLIVLSVASIGVESLPALPAWAVAALRIEEIVVVAVFSLEYLLRIVAARQKLAFIVSLPGLIDLLSIAPFFLAGLDARWVRVLRLLRAVRVLKLQTHILEATVAERTRALADKNAALEQAQAQIKAELDAARALQLAILPAAFPARPGCAGAARMIPATSMGGDFYDFIDFSDGQVGLVIADVSGHGVPAAFFMAVARTQLRELAARHSEPAACLAHANRALCTQNPMDLFVTVFYCVFDPAAGVLRYANAGHNPPYLCHGDGSVETLDGASGLVLGVMADAGFISHTVALRPGDRVVLFTDGVTEACDPAGRSYGTERLLAEIRAHAGTSAAAVVALICHSLASFTGAAAQADDITLSVLAWDPP